MSVSKNWLFTINNPTAEPVFDQEIQYLLYQKEKGEQGTEHYQGYVVFAKPRRLAGAKKWAPTAHLEVRRGTHEEAKAYCSKVDSRIGETKEQGIEPQQGKRSDLDDVKKMIESGSKEVEIADTHFGSWCRYRKSFHAYKVLLSQNKSRETPTIIIETGPTKTGKTKRAVAWADGKAFWLQRPGKGAPPSGWWDGYDGEAKVVIDEFYGWLSYDWLLRLLDRYPLRGETKGGMLPIVAHEFYITSNKPWTQWYQGIDDKTALKRRIDEFGQVLLTGGVHVDGSGLTASPTTTTSKRPRLEMMKSVKAGYYPTTEEIEDWEEERDKSWAM